MTTVCVLRSLALLMREVMAGSVLLPTMDFMADPVSPDGSGLIKEQVRLTWRGRHSGPPPGGRLGFCLRGYQFGGGTVLTPCLFFRIL